MLLQLLGKRLSRSILRLPIIFKYSDTKVSLFVRINHCVRLNTYCFAGVKKDLFIFAREFVHYIPARRKNAISMHSTYSNNFAAFGRLGSRDFDRREFDVRPLKQLLRETA
jgi:hypothetical protein